MAELNDDILKRAREVAKMRSEGKTTTLDVKDGSKPFERTLGGALGVLDQLQRPYYGLMNVGKDIVGGEKGFHPLRSFARGVSLKEKTDFSDVLTEAGWQPESMVGKIAKGGVSFVGGVLLDPVTYLSFGTSSGLRLGSKVLNKKGSTVFLRNLRKATRNKNLKKVEDIGKYFDEIDPDVYRGVAGDTLDILNKNPDQYFNKSMMRYAGKEMPAMTNALKGVARTPSNLLKPFLNTELGVRAKRAGEATKKTLGELFSPGYDIRNSKKLTLGQKFKLLDKLEADRSLRVFEESKTIEETRRLYNGMPKKKREQVTFEIEGFFNKKKKLSDIKDKEVRRVVRNFQGKMKEIWKSEVRAGLRDNGTPWDKAYVRRLIRGVSNPEDVEKAFNKQRKLSGPQIEKLKESYKKGDSDFYFETDSAKAYLFRVNQSNMRMMRDQTTNWLESNKFIKKFGDKATDGMKIVDVGGKKFEAIPEIARELEQVNNALTDVGMKKFLGMYDSLQNYWKLSSTALFPSFHARNAVSNVWLSWLGGNNSIQTYKDAFKLQQYGRAVKKGKKIKDDIIELGGKKYKMSQLWKMGGETGVIGTGWMGADFLKDLAVSKKELSYYTRLPRRMGTVVENNARIASFMDRLAKGDDPVSASNHVKKFLFDYGQLTEFERSFMKRVVPFYTFMRKNIPLQLEQLVKQPGKYTGALHAQRGVESMTPAQEEQFLPEWMREQEMYVRLPGLKYFKPDLPFQDLAKVTLGDRTIRDIVSQTTPLIKSLFEIASNKNMFNGRPLADQRLPKNIQTRQKIYETIKGNIRLTNEWKKATDEDRTIFDKFLNLLFGLNTTPFDIAESKKYSVKKRKEEKSALKKFTGNK
jgi:hypothetical protein